jgi:hypothetical protein
MEIHKMLSLILVVLGAVLDGVLGGVATAADVTVRDWSSNYSFSTAASKALILQQADLIKKAESDYYDGLGKTVIGTVNNYDQQGIFNNVTASTGAMVPIDDKYSVTTSVGATNTSTTSVTNSGDGNVDVSSGAESVGSQDGSVRIDQ